MSFSLVVARRMLCLDHSRNDKETENDLISQRSRAGPPRTTHSILEVTGLCGAPRSPTLNSPEQINLHIAGGL